MNNEALKQALWAAYLAGFNASGQGWNAEYPFQDNDTNPEQNAGWVQKRDKFVEQALSAQQGQVIGNTVHLSLDQLAGLFPPPAEGCDYCNNPLYAGTVCKNCGRLAEQPAQQEPVAWRNAAIRVGEDLCSVGPFGYYDMTAEQWLDWALSVVTVHAPPAKRKPLTSEEVSDLRIKHGITSHGRGIKEFTQIVDFVRDIEAAIKGKP